MTLASVRAAVEHIARTGVITPHQLASFTRLDERLRAHPDIAEEFTELWRAEGSPATKPPEVKADWVSQALKIIKEFEGCHLAAYLDPVGIPTIGWGATRLGDRAVQLGDRISQARADQLLAEDVAYRYQRLVELLPLMKQWPGNRVAALVSWAYNVGLGAVADSTLRRRLLAGDNPVETVTEELPRWDKADGVKSEGLARRRAAEVDLFVGQQIQQNAKATPASPFSTRLTSNIQVGEFALFQEVRRFKYQHQVDTAIELAKFMERCRAQFGGRPVIITSGYRPAAINKSVGGASGSEHLYDAPGVGAVDFYIKDLPVKTLQDWCHKHWPFSLGYGAPKGFVHLGIRKGRPRVRWDY